MKQCQKIKYAVCVWGIGQDKVRLADDRLVTAGLTFGPATGENFTKSYRACPGTTKENPGGCLHWMSWEEIVSQSKKDPMVFEKCLKNGCTHSVDITIPSDAPINGDSLKNPMEDGDGAGCLSYVIANDYRAWNEAMLSYGGWPGSRMRTTLNGRDGRTKVSIAGENLLDADSCLFAMFPKVLRDNIVRKMVESDTNYDNIVDSDDVTFDKLWLFSGREVYGASGRGPAMDNVIRPNEGVRYQRSKYQGFTTLGHPQLYTYSENGVMDSWWLRTLSRSRYYCADYVDAGGSWNSACINSSVRFIAPGFCLPGPDTKSDDDDSSQQRNCEDADTYEVTFTVTGRYTVFVKAESPEEAQAKANYACQEKDFGALEDIDWNLVRTDKNSENDEK